MSDRQRILRDDFPHVVGVRKADALGEAQNWRCCYCGIRCDGEADTHNAPTIDHVVPICAGGRRHWSNEVMACNQCNNARSGMYARRFHQMVKWKGRDKAAKWAYRQLRKRSDYERKAVREALASL